MDDTGAHNDHRVGVGGGVTGSMVPRRPPGLKVAQAVIG